MNAQDQSLAAARLLAGSWQRGEHIEDLSAHCRPATRADGYAVQALWPQALGDTVAGQRVEADFGWIGRIAASFA